MARARRGRREGGAAMGRRHRGMRAGQPGEGRNSVAGYASE
jgi:hypothetical protein